MWLSYMHLVVFCGVFFNFIQMLNLLKETQQSIVILLESFFLIAMASL